MSPAFRHNILRTHRPIEQQVNNTVILALNCNMQGGGVSFGKQIYHRHMPLLYSPQQRRPAVVVLRVRINALLLKQSSSKKEAEAYRGWMYTGD